MLDLFGFSDYRGGEGQMKIRVYGEPVAKARPRMTRNGHVYTPAKTRAAEEEIAATWRRLYGGSCTALPVRVRITFAMQAPRKGASVIPQKRPDIDNLVKTVLDALNGVAYTDDKQVYAISATKCWSLEPYTEIEIVEG